MGWVVAGIVTISLVVAGEIALRKARKEREARRGLQCPWCGKVLTHLPDYIDHKDQHLKDEIEKRR